MVERCAPILLEEGRQRFSAGSRSSPGRSLLTAAENVTLHVYPEEDHSGTVLASMADSTTFLREAFVANE